MFSQGEKQLFTLCRVLLETRPKVIVFDEATSNMDTQTDNFVQSTIKETFPNVTKILIAHRLSTVILCDQILVLEKGEVVEVGNANELLMKSPNDKNGLMAMVAA
jgi:ABC-type multidrug transport system fused ATPase/permease subunit